MKKEEARIGKTKYPSADGRLSFEPCVRESPGLCGSMVMRSVHEFSYGHKFAGSTEEPVVVRGAEAGDRRGVTCARLVGVEGGAAIPGLFNALY